MSLSSNGYLEVIAERDLWRWRCEQIEAMLEPNSHQSDCIHPSCCTKRELHAAALEIMAARPKDTAP